MNATTLLSALPAEWAQRIRTDEAENGISPDVSFLQWPVDSHCGAAVLAVVTRAEETANAWPDVAEEVRQVALQQINVICYG